MTSESEDLVQLEDACPLCGERNIDRLIWLDDENVECQMCGTVYRPDATPHE